MEFTSWGAAAAAGGGGAPTPPDAALHRDAIAGPGKTLFAVVVAGKDNVDARAHVRAALASTPANYNVVEHACGAFVFLGDGAPTHDAGPAHAPQLLECPGECVVALVSPHLDAAVVAEAFRVTCAATVDDPKSRAVGLKLRLRELSADARFSFVLLDLATSRVFAASTALSAPLAMGHTADGTLLVACTRSGSRAATTWPPRWSASTRAGAGAPQRQPQLAHQYSASPGGAPLPLTPERSVSPSTDRSRSRSPSACSTSSASSSDHFFHTHAGLHTHHAAGAAAAGTPGVAGGGVGGGGGGSDIHHHHGGGSIQLSHLPSGRFVYGRRYLQPFEFSAFWHSAETNRAGARAPQCPAEDSHHQQHGIHGGAHGGIHGLPNSSSYGGGSSPSPSPSSQSPSSFAFSPSSSSASSPSSFSTLANGGGNGGNGGNLKYGTSPPPLAPASARKWSSSGSRSDTSSSWRNKTTTTSPTSTLASSTATTAAAAAAVDDATKQTSTLPPRSQQQQQQQQASAPTAAAPVSSSSSPSPLSSSAPMAVPCGRNSTWPKYRKTSLDRSPRDHHHHAQEMLLPLTPEDLMYPFNKSMKVTTVTSSGGGGGGIGAGGVATGVAKAAVGAAAGAAGMGKWVPRGRWTQQHEVCDSAEEEDADAGMMSMSVTPPPPPQRRTVSEGSSHGRPVMSELTKALSSSSGRPGGVHPQLVATVAVASH